MNEKFKNSTKICMNMYREAREHAGLTPEDAAYEIGVCRRQLDAYELGEKVPPHHTAKRMSEIYHYPYLWFDYLESTTPNSICSFSISRTNLEYSSLKALNRAKLLDRHTEEINSIVRDCKIESEEMPVWAKIEYLIDELITSLIEVKIHAKESMIHV